MAERTLEQEAQDYGWNPNFQGEGKLSAEEFVERGRNIMPILRKNNERLQGELAETRRLITDLQESAAEFKKYHGEVEQRTYERALKDLKAQKVVALGESKFEEVVEIDAALVELDKSKPKPVSAAPPPPPDPTKDPVYVAWAQEHSSWLGKDKERTAYATASASYIRAMEPTLKGKDFLDKVAEEVRMKFDGKGNAPAPSPAPSKVEGGSRGMGARGGKSYADLPPEAKAACDRFGTRVVGKDKTYKTEAEWRAQYVQDYDWS